jgi:hypothetical protein
MAEDERVKLLSFTGSCQVTEIKFFFLNILTLSKLPVLNKRLAKKSTKWFRIDLARQLWSWAATMLS